MSESNEAQQARKGTRSCIECRTRKVKCIWLPNDAETCRQCHERRRVCMPQKPPARDGRAFRITSRDRIKNLESNVAQLWRLVQRLEGQTPSQGDSHEAGNESVGIALLDDGANDSDSSDLSPANPPTHLRQLFQDGALHFTNPEPLENPTSAHQHISESHKQRARVALRSVMPRRESIAVVAGHVAPWLTIAQALFILPSVIRSDTELLQLWDKTNDSNADPFDMAVLLVSFALTVQQIPSEQLSHLLGSDIDAAAYVRRISDTIESAIVQNDVLAATFEGLEVSLLWIRLPLVQSRIQKVWLPLRRIIALAEYIGLPNAVHRKSCPTNSSATSDQPLDQRDRNAEGADLWLAICSIDRLAAMFFNLPMGTAHYPYPIREPLVDGMVDTQIYLSRLADAASGIQEIDILHARGVPSSELCEKVLRVDGQLRRLANSTPRGWWDLSSDILCVEHILQHFHQYITVRAHVQLAMQNRDGEQYAYSELVCTDACRDLAQRYIIFRRLLPPGFFVSWLIDLQILTAAIFLLNKYHCPGRNYAAEQDHSSVSSIRDLVNQVVETMEFISGTQRTLGGAFARQATNAIRSVAALLGEDTATTEQSLTLRVPLLGQIDVRRKASAPPRVDIGNPQTTKLAQSDGPAGSQYQEANAQDAGVWSMEISNIPAFLADTTFASVPWLSSDAHELSNFDFLSGPGVSNLW